MPLFDLFKKPNKKEPGKAPENKAAQASTGNPFASPEMQKKRYEAAMDFLNFFQEKTPLLNGRPHAGTVMSIAARLAGTSLFRAINKQEVPAGTVVLSEEVNQAYPQLLNQFAYYCKQNGIDVMAKPLVQEIPEPDKPLMDLAQIQTEYQKEYRLIMKKHGLDDLESARAGMVVSSILFQYHCVSNKDIDPYVATGIVATGVVEGAKTSPVPLQSSEANAKLASNPQSNQVEDLLRTIASASVNGSGTRLIVGKGMAPLQEAQANGGKYLMANPGVLMKLDESNIDSFLVYQVALRLELEAKVSRIDVVNVNIEEVVQEWSNKPSDKAPTHARQILWLKANAEKFGYEQRENSWVLK